MHETLTEEDHTQVAELLGREARGLMDIPVRAKSGEPVVIQVDAMVAGKPFPTLFWLVDKRLNFAIDQLEAGGLIAQLQAQVDASISLQESLAADHRAYIDLRQQLMPDATAKALAEKGFGEVLLSRGIGGIANFQRIRCLHTYYGAHLVVPNTIGRLVDAYWAARGVSFEHL